MSDHLAEEPSQESGSAEERLRRGLLRLGDASSVSLSAALALARHRRRRAVVARVLVAVALAVAAAVAAGVASRGLWPAGPGPTPGDTGVYLPAEGGSAPGPSSDPPTGFRWRSYDSVAVAIPLGWPDAAAPHPDYCLRSAPPSEPYVDADYRVEPLLGECAATLPDADQVTHVTMNRASDPPPWSPPSSSWLIGVVVVEGVRVTVTYAPDQGELASLILASVVAM